jgi:hypothetical protein
MSSTPSITRISVSRSCGRQGAKPTPQLPISTVVTPWPDDGLELIVPGRLAVIVGVDVDEARRHDEAPGVDLLAARARHATDGGYAAFLDRDVALAWLAAGAVDDGAVADDEVESGCHGALPVRTTSS